jgi:hypothetical protein
MHYFASYDFCEVKTVCSISENFLKVWIPLYSGHPVQVVPTKA